MLLAIDVGNSHTHFGIWEGTQWVRRWDEVTSEQLGSGLEPSVVRDVVFATVVPSVRPVVQGLASRLTGHEARELILDSRLGVRVNYNPPQSLGADRLANVIGALAKYAPPILVIDIGTATTFEAVAADGSFAGGAILAGAQVAVDALTSATAQLPRITLAKPSSPLGASTVEALQIGAVLGHAGAIQRISEEICQQLSGEVTVVATGGLAERFAPLVTAIRQVDETLTLDGLVEAWKRLATG